MVRRLTGGDLGLLGRFGLIGILAGCTVGPNYQPPQPAVPERFLEQGNTGAQTKAGPAVGEAWWTKFRDPVLDELIERARQTAPDVKVAEARVREARAMLGIAGAAQYPEADVEPTYQRRRGSANVPVGAQPGGLGQGVNSNLYLANFDAGWELDIFGGVRRAVESAGAAVQASDENLHDVMLTLISEIARNYIELRSTQRQIEIARETLSLRRDTLDLVRTQLASGLATSLDAARGQSTVADIEAEIPTLIVAERAAIYRIGVLVGEMPESLPATLGVPGALLEVSGTVPAGLPSDLLRRRPDLRKAERQLAAANARIGVATADLYPHFSLTGFGGFESLSSSNFLDASSGYFSIGPSIKWLIFDAGKVRNEILAERARTDAAAAVYQRTVLQALSEVETALVAFAQNQVHREALTREVAANRDALDLAKRLYERGLEDFLSVLDADRSLHAAEDQLILSDRDTAIALIALYKALGGGWGTAAELQ